MRADIKNYLQNIASKLNCDISTAVKHLDDVTISVTEDASSHTVFSKSKDYFLTVSRLGVGTLLTPYGNFLQYEFKLNDRWNIYSVLVMCQDIDENMNPIFQDKSALLMRIDSGCQTGQVFHDLTCDCREQLYKAMKLISKKGEGIIVHIPSQDGRGRGMPWKLGTLELQVRLGVDTVTSAELLAKLLGEDTSTKSLYDIVDIRDYRGVVAILKYFNTNTKLQLLITTNNPKKIECLVENGFECEFVSIAIPKTKHTNKHISAKKQLLGHLIDKKTEQ